MVTKRQPAKAPPRSAAKRTKRQPAVPTSRAFFDRLTVIGRSVPRDAWKRVPRDAARNFDDYLESEKP
jgi:hypothetical protein